MKYNWLKIVAYCLSSSLGSALLQIGQNSFDGTPILWLHVLRTAVVGAAIMLLGIITTATKPAVPMSFNSPTRGSN